MYLFRLELKLANLTKELPKTDALLNKLVADQKYRQQNRPGRRSPSSPPESKQKIASEAPPLAAVQPSQVVALVQLPYGVELLQEGA